MTEIIWHTVTIPPDMIGLLGNRAYSAERMDLIEKWLEEQWVSGAFEKWKNHTFHTFKFSREEDAMAFKLRWG